MASPTSFKMLWFEICGLSLTASAHHFRSIQDISRLPSGTPVIEVCEVLGLEHERSLKVGGVARPDHRGMVWFGLGSRATLWDAEANNILVFPPWLHQDCSQALLPACFAHAKPHHDALTWILDIAQIMSAHHTS